MAKMGKLDRMGVAESALSEEGLEDAKDVIQDVLTALESFEEQRETAIGAFTEAQSYHDEREWDSRNDSLEEAANAVEEMSAALDEIEGQSEWVTLPEDRMETLRKVISEVQEHLDALV